MGNYLERSTQRQKNFRKENGLDGAANSFIVFADAIHRDPLAAKAAIKLVTDLEDHTRSLFLQSQNLQWKCQADLQ